MESSFDVLVVGGGINGVGIARDLAGRGWRVLLAERDDLAAHTSSASTKLIHGGLRYLEYYEFDLVRKALQEREVLLRSAPHIMHPLRFVMPHDAKMRPAWLIRLGLWLYDHLARRKVLPGSRAVDLRTSPLGQPLQPRFTKGFVYSDGWVDDARLVVLNAQDARARGAVILPRTSCVEAVREGSLWRAALEGGDGRRHTVQARALVNAAGPWAAQFLDAVHSQDGRPLTGTRSLRLVKGSHIVVPRSATPDWHHDHAYIFQNADGRIIFAIPYEQDFTLIGTTDVEVSGDAGRARIDPAEIDYLCEQASRYLKQPIMPEQVCWTYSGVRPLLDDGADASAVTRDYRLETQEGDGAPVLTVWGGKITTFRKLAEEAADKVGHMLGERKPAWTQGAMLPGGDFSAFIELTGQPVDDFRSFLNALRTRYPAVPAGTLARMAAAYGSRIDRILDQPPGREVAPGLHEAELRYLRDEEWARDAEDVLWRRSKLGLHYDDAAREQVAAWMRDNTVTPD